MKGIAHMTKAEANFISIQIHMCVIRLLVKIKHKVVVANRYPEVSFALKSAQLAKTQNKQQMGKTNSSRLKMNGKEF